MDRDLFSVDAKVIVITGGMGQLGGQFARTLVDLGAVVALLDLPERIAETGTDIGESTGNGRLVRVGADVTNRDSLEAALEQIERTLGVPDGLINNAAIDSPPSAAGDANPPFERYSEAAWERVMDVNVKGV